MQHGFTTPLEGQDSAKLVTWQDGSDLPCPLRLLSPTVPHAWVDYNLHMSESCFLQAFGDHSDAFFRFIGIDERYRANGHSLYTVQTVLRHLGEAKLGDRLVLQLQLLATDTKRIHLWHSMRHASEGHELATAEQLLIHVDSAAGKSALMPDWLQARLQALSHAHQRLSIPATVGQGIAWQRNRT